MVDVRLMLTDAARRTRRRAYAQMVEVTSRKQARRVSTAPQRVPAHWFRPIPNFGDFITPWVLGANGLQPDYAEPEHAAVVGAGSLLEMLPKQFSGYVWGTGLMHGSAVSLPFAKWLVVRGHLTRQALGLQETRVGDPGLLASDITAAPGTTRWKLGVIPHRVHRSLPLWGALLEKVGSDRSRIIDVRRHPASVVGAIAACDFVVTSSLHGLVVADSYGIPAAWVELEPALKGGRFKFDDHESAVLDGGDRRFSEASIAQAVSDFSAFRSADVRRVDEAKQNLRDALATIRAESKAALS